MKQKLLAYLREKKEVIFLDSCKLPSAAGVESYEWIAAWDIESKFELLTNEKANWNTIRNFVNQKEWVFTAISYDLKNEIAGLISQNKDVLEWPMAVFFTMKNVILCHKNGQIETVKTSGDEPKWEQYSGISETKDLGISFENIYKSMDYELYSKTIDSIKVEIAEGNMYEMNLCVETVLDSFRCNEPFELYRKLVSTSPTPFSAFLQYDQKYVVCASPERFLTKNGETIVSQPIKGTAKRGIDEHEDKANKLHLANSIKERAEHVMIVDLVRNDLSKLCYPGTVEVNELFGIYPYKNVFQMISTVEGKAKKDVDFVDCLLATYPMGSMTGAPKHIVMKYIDRFEKSSRGWYSGSIGYIDPCGNSDLNVVIRSILIDDKKKIAKFSVGGAITYDSNAEAEYAECEIKAKAISDLLFG
ncbi:MAG: anthranilate synthase component I family protein [Flavobacteriales bacterium]|nr:anthranilate synthase component I family protein [Flavobacteriales bacterium]